MPDFDGLQRSFFDGLYTNRIPIAFGSLLVVVVLLVAVWRFGWFGAARRHPVRSGVLIALAFALTLPLVYYTASPLWTRTRLVEPDPVAVVASARPTPAPAASAPSMAPASPIPTPVAEPFVASPIARGRFAGTDDFHFGKGVASIIETAPGSYTLRLDDFSVRNGPDLYVYLSPEADDYSKEALEVGRLKATDGAFGYRLPAGVDPSRYASAIIWCKQFSHLFAVAPLTAI